MDPRIPGDGDVRKPRIFVSLCGVRLHALLTNFGFQHFNFLTPRSAIDFANISPRKQIFQQNHFSLFIGGQGG